MGKDIGQDKGVLPGQEMGASSLRADRVTDAPHQAPSGLGPDGSVPTSAGHTPGPWGICHGYGTDPLDLTNAAHYVAGPDPKSIGIKIATPWIEGAWDHDDEARANAAFIVRACNSHYELLSIARRWAALDGGAWHVDRHAAKKAELLADTNAAIAKATGADVGRAVPGLAQRLRGRAADPGSFDHRAGAKVSEDLLCRAREICADLAQTPGVRDRWLAGDFDDHLAVRVAVAALSNVSPGVCDFCLRPTLSGELVGILEDIKEAADNADTQLCWTLATAALGMMETTPRGSTEQVSA